MDLLIRANANTQIGIGHVMRCMALAQAWQDSGERVKFLMAMESPLLETQLRSEGMEIIHLSVQPGSTDDAIQTANVAQKSGGPWVVIDGYHFSAEYQRIIKDSGLCLLTIDDTGNAKHYYADIVLNQNLHAHEGLYKNRGSYTQLLLGAQYVLLRREFLKWQGRKRQIPEVARKVLVTLGGGDPDNVTSKVIQALQHVEVNGLESVVVVGGSNPHYEELQSAIRGSRFPIRIECNVKNMSDLMAWADVAIAAGGTTSWELAFMGLPSLILVLADNQRSVAERLDAIGAAVNLGLHESLRPTEIAQAMTQLLGTAKQRAEMAQRGQQLVDGEGITRVLMHMKGKMLRLRQVREEDCRLLWEWANDPEVRASAFSSDPIPWEEHVQWFRRKLQEPSCLLFIALNDQGIPVGQVRFDVKNDGEAEIDVSIDRSKRRSGYGSLLISRAVEEIFRVTPILTVHAFMKPYNEGSIRAFERANFKRLGIETVKGNVAVHYVRGRSDAQ